MGRNIVNVPLMDPVSKGPLMISIATSSPAPWPVTQAPAVAPTTAVAAVAPVQKSSGGARSGLGGERDKPAPAPTLTAREQRADKNKTVAQPQAAPLLPRKPPEEGQSPVTGREGNGAKTAALEAEAAEEAQAEQKAKLLDVLSTVWKASAAVVEQALGRVKSAEALNAAEGANAPTLAVATAALPPEAVPQEAQRLADEVGGADAATAALTPPDGYTEQGAGSWSPSELGQLVSQLV